MADRALIVINPNSSETVTAGIDAAIDPLRSLGMPLRCETLTSGPPGIESQAQSDRVIAPLLDFAATLAPKALGYVIACFGDPGVWALRDETDLPVVGIQEAAIATALTLVQRFGVISILPASIPRHHRSYAAMGVSSRVAGDRALGRGVAALSDTPQTQAALVETGRLLCNEDGAEALILGGAGMASYRPALEDALGVPVIAPCQAAVAVAIGRIALNTSAGPRADFRP